MKAVLPQCFFLGTLDSKTAKVRVGLLFSQLTSQTSEFFLSSGVSDFAFFEHKILESSWRLFSASAGEITVGCDPTIVKVGDSFGIFPVDFSESPFWRFSILKIASSADISFILVAVSSLS